MIFQLRIRLRPVVIRNHTVRGALHRLHFIAAGGIHRLRSYHGLRQHQQRSGSCHTASENSPHFSSVHFLFPSCRLWRPFKFSLFFRRFRLLFLPVILDLHDLPVYDMKNTVCKSGKIIVMGHHHQRLLLLLHHTLHQLHHIL